MVLLDLRAIIAVVHHQTRGLRQPPRRAIGQPIDALDAGAIAEVEAGDRIDRQPVGVTGGQVAARRPDQRLLEFSRELAIQQPHRIGERCGRVAASGTAAASAA